MKTVKMKANSILRKMRDRITYDRSMKKRPVRALRVEKELKVVGSLFGTDQECFTAYWKGL